MALVSPTQRDSIKREAEKYQHILSIESELESKRFTSKLSSLISAVYDDCDHSSSKVFKENLKLLTAIVSRGYVVDEVWVKKERERMTRPRSEQQLPMAGSKAVQDTTETSRSQAKEKQSTSVLSSSRSSASCTRSQRHHPNLSRGEDPSEAFSTSRSVAFPKETRSREELPDNSLGPGQYEPNYRLTSARPTAAFSTTSQRMKDFANREISPGPAYSPRYNFLSK